MIITDFALRNRTTVYVLMFIIFIVGLFSYMVLPREAAPDIEIPYVFITTAYEGVSPEDMETLVTMKIEKELKSLKDVKTMQSSSIEGLSSIFVEFTPNIELDDAVQKVRDKVNIAKNELPADLPNDPVVTEVNISEFPVIQVNLTGDRDLVRLKYVAERMQDEIEMLPGVLEADLLGGIEREIRIEFDPDRLVTYNIEPTQAIQAIRQNNLNIPSGSLELGEAKYNVKVPGEFKDPDEINNIVIAIRNNKPVYLLDVADVVDDFEERTSYARLNGKPCVTLAVSKRAGENIIQVCDGVKHILKEAEPHFPVGMGYQITGDQSKDIRQMVSDLENNILSGMFLIMVV
ncbi:MAG: efflux RND transporter permease subunit, partial [Candidatus Sumerlaeota bacterium]